MIYSIKFNQTDHSTDVPCPKSYNHQLLWLFDFLGSQVVQRKRTEEGGRRFEQSQEEGRAVNQGNQNKTTG
jgi:hypothetical protein